MSDPPVEGVDPSSGTGAGMVAFLNFAIKRNELVEGTAVALRTGVNRVLETDPSLSQTEVKAMDVDDVIRRFKNKFRAQMKTQSLSDYEKRFRQTVDMYTKWLDGDPSWRPAPRKSAAPRRTKNEGGSATAGSNGANAAVVSKNPIVTAPQSTFSPAGPSMVEYPYPVRPGLLARISLPADLTAKEAERVAKFVASLAFDERLAITSGPESVEQQEG